MVIIRAVFVALTVRIVVLLLKAHQILEREPVMTGDVIEAGLRGPTGGLENVAAPRHARGELRRQVEIRTPELASRIAELTVPLRPALRKIPQLIALLAQIPGFGDELALR